jgi:hypothetical protein
MSKIFIPVIFFLCHIIFAAQFENMNSRFSRTSHIMARSIAVPTMANLDYAAYIANPVRFDPDTFAPKAPANKITPSDCNFRGTISCQYGDIDKTPLTLSEKSVAIAWEPLQKKMWEKFKTDAFSRLGSSVNSYKWADPSVFAPYQEIVSVYLHDSAGIIQFWAKIEFKPWVNFVSGMADEHKDGFKSLYGKLNIDKIDRKTLTAAVSWIKADYCRKILTKSEMVDWANDLASYWYPKYNTDIVDMTGKTIWPDDQTEEEIINELGEFSVKNPAVVIRGNPFGSVIYNVFTIKNFQPDSVQTVYCNAAKNAEVKNVSVISKNFSDNNKRFSMEIEHNGEYRIWAGKYKTFTNELMNLINSIPKSQMGFIGKDGWLFFRKDIDILNSGDLNAQKTDKNPVPHIVELKNYLKSRNIDLLFVPVPDKSEVYYEKLPVDFPPDSLAIVNPYERKVLKDLQDSGVEVIDLLPLFLEAKKDDVKYGYGIYQKQDTHWTDRGLEIAADAIAGRIKQYGWYEAESNQLISYTVRDTFFSRQGDIVDKLDETKRISYPPVNIAAKQVLLPEGTLYKGSNPNAPAMLIGDSFTGVFELVDCKGAGVGAHIAEKTGLPVDILTSWGGGPLVREKMLRSRSNYMSYKKIVVYMMVERDLYNYSEGWQPLGVK